VVLTRLGFATGLATLPVVRTATLPVRNASCCRRPLHWGQGARALICGNVYPAGNQETDLPDDLQAPQNPAGGVGDARERVLAPVGEPPLSSTFGTYKTVKARLWPWLEQFFRRKSLTPSKLFPPRSEAVDRGREVEYLDVKFRRGLVFKAHRLLCHSTLGSRVIKKVEYLAGGVGDARQRVLVPVSHLAQGSGFRV